MSKIQRNTFVQANKNKQLDLQKLDGDSTAKTDLAKAGLSVDKLREADKNQDGRIDAKEAFEAADNFDHDGSRRSLIDTDQLGQALPAGQALNQLGLLLNNESMQAAPSRAEKAQRRDFVQTHQDEAIDLEKLANNSLSRADLKDAGVDMAALHRADRNQDGRLDAKEAFRAADHLDSDGHAASLDSKNALGQKTRAGQALGQLGVLLGQAKTAEVAEPDTAAVTEADTKPPTHKASGEDIAMAARDRVARFGKDYGVEGVWHSPNPHIPGNAHPDSTPYSGTKGHWKCNLFGLDSVYQAGFEVPRYGKGDSGWYPIATEIPSFTTGKNPYFDKVDEVQLVGMSAEEKRSKIRDLMRQAKPGDLLMANHPGPIFLMVATRASSFPITWMSMAPWTAPRPVRTPQRFCTRMKTASAG